MRLDEQPESLRDSRRDRRHRDASRSSRSTPPSSRDGACIAVPRGTVVERRSTLLFVVDRAGADAARRTRASSSWPDAARALTVIEHYVGRGRRANLTNAVTEIVAGAARAVDHYALQRAEAPHAFHVGGLHARLGARRQPVAFDARRSAAARAQRPRLRARRRRRRARRSTVSSSPRRAARRQPHAIDHVEPALHEPRATTAASPTARGRGVFNGKVIVHARCAEDRRAADEPQPAARRRGGDRHASRSSRSTPTT